MDDQPETVEFGGKQWGDTGDFSLSFSDSARKNGDAMGIQRECIGDVMEQTTLVRSGWGNRAVHGSIGLIVNSWLTHDALQNAAMVGCPFTTVET